MSDRFANLKKIPDQPAMRLLAAANTKLQTKTELPASAGVPAVLAELEKAGAFVEMLRLMSVALPGRERVWWACLAGRDIIGPDAAEVPLTLSTAEHWVRRPGDETQAAVKQALDAADTDDDLTLCAMTALYADGTLGPGEMKEMSAPPGGAAAAAFGMNIMALQKLGLPIPEAADVLIDRALDIARGGNGKPKGATTTAEG
ncbi:hypothetical protein RGUI_3040 [Rhodovulum sp. P5]|uniref:DUF6931 family protein n=1 Tax=Rhodovulum sp. P5 TaxID=1564506 RepID=UPI0009C235AF|nr:hypothetical protein [Rhodovulum sp. P5]ARE41181.1 hypothetical protein RGUI_3040 [Rhodovulum sp. P5]